MSNLVLFRELESVSDKKIGVATLNSEKSLNALSLDMVNLLMPQLLAWHADKDIAMVMLEGAGEKAFCAGGDVVQLYNSTVAAGKGNYSAEVEEFFTKEYELDHLIHTYTKPILLWGHGIVMGGGLGLLAGASHRVVTEKSRIAMPEITIGLYPDVGGSYFLNRMPAGCGLFLGLTGASINSADAKFVNLADYFISVEHKIDLIEELLLVNWESLDRLNHQKLSELLAKFEQQDISLIPEGNLQHFAPLLAELAECKRVEAAVVKILDQQVDDKWFNKAQASLAHGSALTAHIIYRQLAVGKNLSIADCFRLELGLSVQCSAIGEFAEGVRALLIDKDNKPQWHFNTVHDVDEESVNNMFVSPWSSDKHPLKNLGN
ncbi:enoyl-CoA hydratase/isomerase family protein [Psychrosphaera sp. F3M07]|uniref:enoyl-CoA hydratase/isomerase family protein n=1 Tax=Psychrosphaera sp. F3M07 TaxID=2841560 RepID=UPI001C095725|nr:enoyl-CoA hydratase/isomerase family protein [Psychrosphaera sp. F3M07]MBU2917337.1 enoyl-CoA hydratase/isomerase family protein [Psychrosphaera sp. F3M07]